MAMGHFDCLVKGTASKLFNRAVSFAVMDICIIIDWTGGSRIIAMKTLTVTSRGQVTFRKEILQHLGIQPGEKIEIELLPGGRGVLKASPSKKINGFLGLLAGRTKKTATIDQINQAVEEGWAARK
jgi:bifunctional DNA-binding transcriptional regulator/antitoxin component of YhaV-PrlF toxin-antitoxin module